ncbi:response regulator transcription factor [Sediminibacterium roseum]|uniref:Response regulator transcription factor n=1 Tax=Sediminibacterium roseum TaxID=1978412 RepID=A0ABW9ZSX0_9BACT|nr:response regulator transcription factor [Sediminibacterium roseum]NCI50219.1 response regulator transcription factor [Sediminibacterium roseum]
MTKIAVVDDSLKALNAIIDTLSSEDWIEVVLKCSDAFEIIRYCNNQSNLPDIILVDVHMDKMDGVILTDYLHDHFPKIKVIGLSTYIAKDIVEDMLSSGAWGYVNKINLRYLTKAIRSVSTYKVYIDPMIAVDASQRLVLIKERARQKEIRRELQLTKREATFVTLNSSSLEYTEIAQLMDITPKAVINIFARLAKKLHLKSRHSLLLFSVQKKLTKITHIPDKKEDD